MDTSSDIEHTIVVTSYMDMSSVVRFLRASFYESRRY
jgi:hypothetical protein